jgi:hypothetical protein
VQLKNDQEDKQFKTILSKSAFSSDVSDFSPVYYGSQIIFTSQKGGKIDPWTGKSFTNLYITDENKSNPVMLEGNLMANFIMVRVLLWIMKLWSLPGIIVRKVLIVIITLYLLLQLKSMKSGILNKKCPSIAKIFPMAIQHIFLRKKY